MKRRLRNPLSAAGGGALIGALGGLIGLGGAEFRLPLLIGAFGFGALEAVILNKAMSLVVVAAALPFRMRAVPLIAMISHWTIVVNLLAGSIVGAWLGAGWATRLKARMFYRVISVLLVVIALALLSGHGWTATGHVAFSGWLQVALGLFAGFGIGIIASLLGVAGGELLIPTLMLLFGVDLKLAGSLSLAVSLPTMLAGFTRYSRDSSFAVLGNNRWFAIFMAAGSIAGAYAGALVLGRPLRPAAGERQVQARPLLGLHRMRSAHPRRRPRSLPGRQLCVEARPSRCTCGSRQRARRRAKFEWPPVLARGVR